ncbi:MAG: site-specific integrase [Bacteroidetes bacterium]|nr:site-specific integrase [Bacteroidota bacterium]
MTNQNHYMYTANLIHHNGSKRIAIYFENKEELIQRFKLLKGARWSRTLRCWHLPDNHEYRKLFKISTYENGQLTFEKLQLLEQFEKWLNSKRYSDSTIKTYMGVVSVFLTYFKEKAIESITNEDIITFNNDYILKRRLSSTYQNQFVNGLKLFYRIIENKSLEIDIIHRPRPERKLPRILSKEEVKAIITAPINLKHRTMLSLIYACGLRRSELLNITFKDINRNRLTLHVFQSKGKKDRIVPLSPKILEMIEDYYRAYRPKVWLFEGQESGTQYSPKSLQCVLKQALEKAKIKKSVTLHWLRHSYATHLLESGTDLRYIQELLGHNSSRTTEIYTHVSTKSIEKIKSPFDDL